MGIPSPLIASVVSPLVRLQQLSPELALQSVSEEVEGKCRMYDMELLPVSSIDLKKESGGKAGKAWADTQDSDEEADEASEVVTTLSRELSGRVSEDESLEMRSDSSAAKMDAPDAKSELLQAKGVVQSDVASLMASSGASETDLPAGPVVQLLCHTSRDANNALSVVPCLSDDISSGGNYDTFWCHMQTQKDGDVRITPCTDAAASGAFWDASGTPLDAIALPGAPEKPAEGSHAPTWIYGATWPFCVAPTTLMLTSLPVDLLQEDLIEILDKEGFNGFYDFVYLVLDPLSERSLGCAIVNLTRYEYGLALSAMMHGRTSWCGTIAAGCRVSWALPMQGLAQLVDTYQEIGCNDSPLPVDMRPTFFSTGFPSSFPQPSQHQAVNDNVDCVLTALSSGSDWE